MVGQGGGGNRVYPTKAKNTDKTPWDEFDYVNGCDIPDDYHDAVNSGE